MADGDTTSAPPAGTSASQAVEPEVIQRAVADALAKQRAELEKEREGAIAKLRADHELQNREKLTAEQRIQQLETTLAEHRKSLETERSARIQEKREAEMARAFSGVELFDASVALAAFKASHRIEGGDGQESVSVIGPDGVRRTPSEAAARFLDTNKYLVKKDIRGGVGLGAGVTGASAAAGAVASTPRKAKDVPDAEWAEKLKQGIALPQKLPKGRGVWYFQHGGNPVLDFHAKKGH